MSCLNSNVKSKRNVLGLWSVSACRSVHPKPVLRPLGAQPIKIREAKVNLAMAKMTKWRNVNRGHLRTGDGGRARYVCVYLLPDLKQMRGRTFTADVNISLLVSSYLRPSFAFLGGFALFPPPTSALRPLTRSLL